jgi:hypothetical protein
MTVIYKKNYDFYVTYHLIVVELDIGLLISALVWKYILSGYLCEFDSKFYGGINVAVCLILEQVAISHAATLTDTSSQ